MSLQVITLGVVVIGVIVAIAVPLIQGAISRRQRRELESRRESDEINKIVDGEAKRLEGGEISSSPPRPYVALISAPTERHRLEIDPDDSTSIRELSSRGHSSRSRFANTGPIQVGGKLTLGGGDTFVYHPQVDRTDGRLLWECRVSTNTGLVSHVDSWGDTIRVKPFEVVPHGTYAGNWVRAHSANSGQHTPKAAVSFYPCLFRDKFEQFLSFVCAVYDHGGYGGDVRLCVIVNAGAAYAAVSQLVGEKDEEIIRLPEDLQQRQLKFHLEFSRQRLICTGTQELSQEMMDKLSRFFRWREFPERLQNRYQPLLS